MRKYTSKQNLQNYTLQEIDAVFNNQIDSWIEAVSKQIEQQTNRVFIADAVASPRLYNGNNRQHLIIDDCIEVTKVEVGNNIWGDTFAEIDSTGINRYYTLPTNNEEEGVPIRKIGLRARVWIEGHANHRITAKWGYSEEVPEDIEFAATVMTAGIMNAKRDGGKGDVTSEKIGQYAVTYSDKQYKDLEVAKEILESYKRYYL